MSELHLFFGVVDVAYSDANGSGGATTTGKVAAVLEKRYHVMRTFFDLRKEKIAGYLADSMASAIQDLVNGAPRRDPTFGATQKIEAEFRAFIYADEMTRINVAITGKPLSAAAAAGVSHRRKSPYSSKNPARPAFVDTALYVNSFRAWTSPVAVAVPNTTTPAPAATV